MHRLLCAASLCAAALAGCQPRSDAPPAMAKGLKITLDAKAPAEGGLPASFRLVIQNGSSRPILFRAPSPLCPEDQSNEPQYPLLGIAFQECKDVYWPAYTDLQAKRVPQAASMVLAPGQTWTHEYDLKDFYFWGPCGPASDEDIKDYYKPGNTVLHMRAFLGFPPVEKEGEEPGALPMAESTPITVRCAVKPEMLEAKGSP